MKHTVSLWLSWTFAASIGSTLGFVIGASLDPLVSWGEYGSYFMLMTIFVPGLLIGFGQWAILRTRSRKSRGWKVVTCQTIALHYGDGMSLVQLLGQTVGFLSDPVS